MPAISWVQYRERVVGQHSPKYADVDNRPLRQVVELHGYNPDTADFPGLHHFPVGAYIDDIYENTALHGVFLHGDVTLVSGKHTINASDTFNIALAGHELDIDGGNINITHGLLSAQLKDIKLGNDSPFSGANPFYVATFYVAESATFRINSLTNARIRFLQLDTEQVNISPSYVWTRHFIAGLPLVSLNNTPGAERLMFYLSPAKTTWFRPDTITPSMEYDQATQKWTFFDKVIFNGETGWTAGSGGTQKGGLVAGTSTLSTTQSVVNSIVALLLANGLALP